MRFQNSWYCDPIEKNDYYAGVNGGLKMVNRKLNILKPKPKSRFVKVRCVNCGNEQIIFGCATTTIKCNVCEKALIQTTGGKARILTRISEVLS